MNRESLFSHVGGVFVGFCIGALAAYGVISPSVDRLKAAAENAEYRASDLGEKLLACTASKSSTSREMRIDELTTELARVEKEKAALAADKERLARQAGELIAANAPAVRAAYENANVATVLYEPPPPSSLQTVAQAALIIAGKNIAIPAMGNMRPRWYIPGKVTPILYGAPSAQDQFIWVDAAGNHAGPFPAKVYGQP